MGCNYSYKKLKGAKGYYSENPEASSTAKRIAAMSWRSLVKVAGGTTERCKVMFRLVLDASIWLCRTWGVPRTRP